MLDTLDDYIARVKERAELKEQVLAKLEGGPVSGLTFKALMVACDLDPNKVSLTKFRRAIGCLANGCSEHGPARIHVSRVRREGMNSYEDRPYTITKRAS